MKTAFRILVLCLPLALASPAAAEEAAAKYPSMAPINQYHSPDQAAEIALARSAAPKSISDDATVLTLGKSGYETTVKGKNGFVCFSGRSWMMDYEQPEFWNPKVRTPQCWNAVAASSCLAPYLERTQWVLAGVSKDEMAARTKAKVAAHKNSPPAPGSMVYMLSKEQYIQDPTPPGEARWYPHVMFFVPATDGAPWGANMQGAPIFSQTSTAEPFTTYFVVTPRWSDGTLGPYAPTVPGQATQHHHG
jgi:hypothetical protein